MAVSGPSEWGCPGLAHRTGPALLLLNPWLHTVQLHPTVSSSRTLL